MNGECRGDRRKREPLLPGIWPLSFANKTSIWNLTFNLIGSVPPTTAPKANSSSTPTTSSKSSRRWSGRRIAPSGAADGPSTGSSWRLRKTSTFGKRFFKAIWPMSSLYNIHPAKQYPSITKPFRPLSRPDSSDSRLKAFTPAPRDRDWPFSISTRRTIRLIFSFELPYKYSASRLIESERLGPYVTLLSGVHCIWHIFASLLN